MNWSRHHEQSSPAVEPSFDTGSDAHPSVDHPRYAELEPEADRNSRVRSRLFQLVLVAVFVIGSGASLFGERGLLDRVRLNRQYRVLDQEVVVQRARVEALRQDVVGLRENPLSRERIAREQLGFVRPGEMLFLLPPDEPVADDEAAPLPAP